VSYAYDYLPAADEILTADNGKQSAAAALVEIALTHYELGISDKDQPYAIPREGGRLVKMLRGGKGSLRAELASRYFRSTGKVATAQALADALMVLEGMAQEEEAEELHMRVAQVGQTVWYDLGDDTGRAVRITPAGWDVMDRAPVLFQRNAVTAPQVEPARGGSLEPLWALMNVNPDDRSLLAAYMAASFLEEIPHPIAAFSGESGTAKSTNSKMVSQILDPSTVPLRKAPKDAESWITAASGSWVVTIDNVSTIPEWFSDALCRASTGDGDVKRQLYTDAGLSVFSFRRCVILTGIDLSGLKGDLTERLLRVELDRITKRRTEADVWGEWDAARATILGGLFDLVSQVLRVLPSIHLENPARLADFHRVIAAVDEVTGVRGMDRYAEKFAAMSEDSLNADPFIAALRKMVVMPFTGTSSQLKALCTPAQSWQVPKGWPASTAAVTKAVRSNAPALRAAGWTVEPLTLHKQAGWEITPPANPGDFS
jgi:hypothetical protein